jgi:hypothetical protein
MVNEQSRRVYFTRKHGDPADGVIVVGEQPKAAAIFVSLGGTVMDNLEIRKYNSKRRCDNENRRRLSSLTQKIPFDPLTMGLHCSSKGVELAKAIIPFGTSLVVWRFSLC